MDFRFDEEQEELRSIAQSFLEENSGSAQVRKAMQSELGYEPALWQQMGRELGWTSVHIPEEYGGLGLGYVELVALLEVMGGALVCAPYFSSVCLGANALLAAGSEEQKREHLPGIAEGRTRATLACAGTKGLWQAQGVEPVLVREGGQWLLRGRCGFVLDGHCADLLVVAAREPESRGTEGISLCLVAGDAAGLERRTLATMDQTRRLAELEFDGVTLPDSALLGAPGEAWPALEHTLRRAAIALAAEQVGGAQRCLDMSVEYAKERVQFGRPIGSFQAIKHKCADMMVEVESARSAAYYSGCVAAETGGSAPASDAVSELSLCAPLAKATCSDAYFHCAAESVQIHGGVGFTWEYDVHLHFKRARFDESFLGDPPEQRERVAQRIGL